MEVILLERVEKLGAIGDVVKVKNGFARNYLLPQQEGAPRQRSQPQGVRSQPRARSRPTMPTSAPDAEKASKGVDGKTVQLIRQASNTGQLYGSVSARDIVEALEGVRARKVDQEPGRARPPDQGDRRARREDRASPGGRGDGQGQRRPLARRGRPAGAGRRRHGRRCSSATRPRSPKSSIRTPSRARRLRRRRSSGRRRLPKPPQPKAKASRPKLRIS